MNKLYPILVLLLVSTSFFSCEKEEIESEIIIPEPSNKEIIKEIGPKNGATVSMFEVPFVVLNYLPEDSIQENGTLYRPKVAVTKFTCGSSILSYETLLKGDTLFIIPNRPLAAYTESNVELAFFTYWEYLEEGQWKHVTDEAGSKIINTINSDFSVDQLGEGYVRFEMNGQVYSDYRNGKYVEGAKGLPSLQLNSPLFKLLEEAKNFNAALEVTFTSGNDSLKTFSYQPEESTLVYIPTDSLEYGKEYTFTLAYNFTYYNHLKWNDYISDTLTYSFYYEDNISVISAIEQGSVDDSYSLYRGPSVIVNHDLYSTYKTRPNLKATYRSASGEESAYELNPVAKNSYEFLSSSPLEAASQYSIKVEGFWEYLDSDGWKKLEVAYRPEVTVFNVLTEDEPVRISAENIEYSYPVDRQFHFLKDEHPNGYLKMRFPQQKVLDKINAGTLQVLMQPLPKTGTNLLTAKLSYDANEAKFTYALPEGLENETLYELTFLAVNAEVDTIYKSYFRTSMHNTFVEKAAAWERSSGWYYREPDAYIIGQTITSGEFFDKREINQLIKLEFLTDTLTNYNTYFKSILYDDPVVEITWRDTSNGKLVPIGENRIRQYGANLLVSDDNIMTGECSPIEGSSAFIFNFFSIVEKDFRDIYDAVNKNASLRNSEFGESVMALRETTIFPAGYYPFKVTYAIPGAASPESTATFLVYKPR